MPIMANRFQLNDLQLSYFFWWQLFGSLIGTILTNWFGKKNKFLTSGIIGCFLMATGISLMNFGIIELCWLGFMVNGLGIGLTLPAVNMLLFELSPERTASALNILNFFWGVGAISAKPFVDIFSDGKSIFLTTSILSIGLGIVGILMIISPPIIVSYPISKEETDESFETPIWTTALAWTIAGFNFIHVGFESGFGGWITTYTGRIEGGEFAGWLSPTLLFFLFFVVGRGVAPIFLRFLSENRMLMLNLFILLTGMIILLIARDVLLLGIGASIAGFGTSSIFPTNMSRFTKTFGPSASRRAMPFFVCGTLGSVFTNWFIGFISESYGNNLRMGMFVLFGSGIVLVFLQAILMLRKRTV